MLQGKLSLHPRGFGFVAFANHEDVFIPAKHLKGAMDGDIVSVSITGRSPKGFEGKIHTVVKRGRRVFVGLITSVGKNGDGVATSLTTGENQTILVQKPP